MIEMLANIGQNMLDCLPFADPSQINGTQVIAADSLGERRQYVIH